MPVASRLIHSVLYSLFAAQLSLSTKTKLLLMFLLTGCMCVQQGYGATINVTTTQWRVSGGPGCSLQEAIYAANFRQSISITSYTLTDDVTQVTPNFVGTNCVAGDGNDTIILPNNAFFAMNHIVDDPANPFGPAATPMVTSKVTIEANGAAVVAGTGHERAFVVGDGGNLTIRNAYVRGFIINGGNAGQGGGGGLGAGGAIYVRGVLTVEDSTFQGNGALGGAGAGTGYAGGGGGGLFGNGGKNLCAPNDFGPNCTGGGGGGSRGNGPTNGGNGGGTVTSADAFDPGFSCGGSAGGADTGFDGNNGGDAPCPGGGGGGAVPGTNAFDTDHDGGKGSFGGGGGGGSYNAVFLSPNGGSGGDGGFGGGGGGAAGGDGITGCVGGLGGNSGGNGGFGGGGGSGLHCNLSGGGPGKGGSFAGNGLQNFGGGGGALGGAIFNDGGSVRILNSTFTGNFVFRGSGGDVGSNDGSDAGGAIFSLNGILTIKNSTISGNSATGSGGGIQVYQPGSTSTSFTLLNTIFYNNGGLNECSVQANSVTSAGIVGNLIQNNDPLNPCLVNGSGVVSTLDPGLGPLQDNGGFTPTMAITKGLAAWGTADPATSLATDQRGHQRPSEDGHGFDIGAFELCTLSNPLTGFPCRVFTNAEVALLTMQVSPANGGTTNPPVGVTSYPLNSIAPIQATPAVGFVFANPVWTGNVTDPTNPSTTVIMNQDQTVTANFVAGACVTNLAGVGTSGTALAPPRVDLTWTQLGNSSSYNILRGATTGGPYIPIGSSTGTTFSDTGGLVNGATEYYVLQPLDGNGTEICQSNEAAVSIPAPRHR